MLQEAIVKISIVECSDDVSQSLIRAAEPTSIRVSHVHTIGVHHPDHRALRRVLLAEHLKPRIVNVLIKHRIRLILDHRTKVIENLAQIPKIQNIPVAILVRPDVRYNVRRIDESVLKRLARAWETKWDGR